jgi:hypothetical protein
LTPLILVILAGMWAAVLLPPYLRDRNETRAAGSRGPLRSRLDALTSSFSGRGSYLPVGGSGRSASEVPLPHGAKQAVHPPGAGAGSSFLPQSSAVQILGPEGRRTDAATGQVTPLRPAGSAAAEIAACATEPVEDAPARKKTGAAIARQRRRDVLHLLLGLVGLTLVATVALGGPVLYANLLADVALVTYVYLLVQRRKVHAEQEMKVAFLPHGGNGVSATALLAQGGGWNPGSGTSVDNIRVLRAEAN